MTMFSKETVAFLTALRENNNRDWFEDNRARFHAVVRDPAQDFAAELSRLLEVRGKRQITARIFRTHRDLRFSKDKTPYNTHVHISFLPADAPPEAPACMVGLEPGKLTLGAGMLRFTPRQLERWREGVAGPRGAELQDMTDVLLGRGCSLPEPELARVPKPYAQDHPHGDLLRRKGFAIWWHSEDTELSYGPDGPERCLEKLASFEPVTDWLIATVQPPAPDLDGQ